MSKRLSKSDKDNSNPNPPKKKFDIWKKMENTATPLTPPVTPSNESTTNDYNIWKKSTDVSTSVPIQLSELKIGICLNCSIRFRVSFKSAKRPCKNEEMFHFYVSDGSQEMQVTVFPQQMDKFFDVIHFNRTFELNNFNVKTENANFPLFVGNGKEIYLLASSSITELDNASVPEFKFNYTQIDDIISLEANSKCDILGIVGANLGATVVGGNKIKRQLVLTDRSKECILLTLWGSDNEEFDLFGKSVVVHNGIVNDYNGTRSINCGKNTLFWKDPEIEDAKSLKTWFDLEMIELNKE